MKITFTDKTSIDNRPDLSDIEKITGGNINEIKEVVNANEDELDATKVKVENINTSLENFNKEVESLKENDTKQDEKIEYLEKEAVRLRQDIQASQLTGEAEGESIDLDDSSGARFKKFGVGGNHSQETREGYNLIGLEQNVQYKVDLKANDFIVVTNQTSNELRLELYTNYGDGEYNDFWNILPNASRKIQVTKDTKALKWTTTVDGIAWINKGETQKPYEQYGATPSLEFPSEIKAVGSNINLLNNILQSQTINGLTVTVNEDKSVKVMGTAASNTNIIFDRHDGKLAAGTYTLKDCQTFIESDENKGWWRNGETKTFTSTATISSNGFYKYYESGTTVNETLYPMVVNGTVATSYVQENQGSANVVVCNKNYIDNDNTSKTIYGVSFIKNEDGSILVNGTPTQDISYEIKKNIKLKDGEKYRLTGCPANGSESKYAMTINQYYDKQSHFNQDYGNGVDFIYNGALPINNTIYIRLFKNVVYNNLIFKPMIEKSLIATNDYVRHQSQNFTMPVQQEMLEGDYFDWKNEKQTNLFEKIVLNGVDKKCTTSKAVGDGSEFQWAFTVAQSLPYVRTVYSNVAKLASDFGTVNGIRISANSTTAYVRSKIEVLNGKEATVENVNELLKTMYDNGNPAIFYIEKASNKELDFTDEQKAVAKKIKETLHTYKNITHIYSTDETSPIMNVEYAKDLNTTINNIQALVINNASEEVNG